jgi:hypothetical protein
MSREKNQQTIDYRQQQAPPLDVGGLWHRFGLGLLIIGSITMIGLGWEWYHTRPILRPFAFALIIGGLAMVAMSLSDALAVFWQPLERFTGRDLDRSGAVGDRLVLVNARRDTHQDEEQTSAFAAFLSGCAAGHTSMRYWEGQGISREQYCKWRDALLRLGYAEKAGSGENAGWRLTSTPETIIEAMF